MPLPRGIGKILAIFGALVAAVFAWIEFYQALNRIKMIVNAINFIFDTYNSATSAWSSFILWKGNLTYQISQPIFDALPVLQIVPGIIWNIIIGAILLYIAIWILDQVMG